MKPFKLAIISLSLAIAFSSCKKDADTANGPSSNYYIKGKKNGAAFSFVNYPMAFIVDMGGLYISVSLSASATSNTASNMEGLNFGINLFKGEELTTGTYTEKDTDANRTVAGVYNPNSKTIVYSSGLIASPEKIFKVVITSKTDSELSGTFEGSFYKSDVTTGTISQTEYVNFTDGEFKLPIKKQ